MSAGYQERECLLSGEVQYEERERGVCSDAISQSRSAAEPDCSTNEHADANQYANSGSNGDTYRYTHPATISISDNDSATFLRLGRASG